MVQTTGFTYPAGSFHIRYIIALCCNKYVSDGWSHSYKRIQDGSGWLDFSSFCGLKPLARKDPSDWTAKIGTPKLSRCKIRIKSWISWPSGGIGMDSIASSRKPGSHGPEHDIFSNVYVHPFHATIGKAPWKTLKKIGLTGPNHQSQFDLLDFWRFWKEWIGRRLVMPTTSPKSVVVFLLLQADELSKSWPQGPHPHRLDEK